MVVGYARISSGAQNLDLRMDALAAGCEKVFTDRFSGPKDDRPVLGEVLELSGSRRSSKKTPSQMV